MGVENVVEEIKKMLNERLLASAFRIDENCSYDEEDDFFVHQECLSTESRELATLTDEEVKKLLQVLPTIEHFEYKYTTEEYCGEFDEAVKYGIGYFFLYHIKDLKKFGKPDDTAHLDLVVKINTCRNDIRAWHRITLRREYVYLYERNSKHT